MPKRKTRSSSKKEETPDARTNPEKTEEADLNHSKAVLGGLKDPTLNSRLSGNEEENEDGIQHFTIPFGEKKIVCEKHAPSSGTTSTALIFTHGAGGGIANAATRDFAIGFGEEAGVVCYQGTMNLVNRVKGFHAVMDEVERGGEGEKVAIGGRSMGARAAALIALEGKEELDALVLVSWPLLTGKGEREEERREVILLDLCEEVEVLFVLGTEDTQCPMEEFEEVRGKMKAKSWVAKVQGADHGMSLKRKQGVEAVRRKTGALAARWLRARKDMAERCSISWDEQEGEVRVDGWDTEEYQRKEKARRIE